MFEQYKSLLLADTVVIIEGKIDIKEDQPVIIVNKVSTPQSRLTSLTA